MDKTCTDEVLSEAVREFPAIYDKSKSGNKDRLIISNAWKEVAKKMWFRRWELGKKIIREPKKKNVSEHSGNEILGHFPSTFDTGGSIHCEIRRLAINTPIAPYSNIRALVLFLPKPAISDSYIREDAMSWDVCKIYKIAICS